MRTDSWNNENQHVPNMWRGMTGKWVMWSKYWLKNVVAKALFNRALGQRYPYLRQISLVSVSFKGRAKSEVLTERSMKLRTKVKLLKS